MLNYVVFFLIFEKEFGIMNYSIERVISMDKTVVELFAGVGGFRVGLNHISRFDSITGLAIENGEWDFVWANQWEPSTKVQPAYDCYVARFGREDVSNLDIAKVKKSEI